MNNAALRAARRAKNRDKTKHIDTAGRETVDAEEERAGLHYTKAQTKELTPQFTTCLHCMES